MDLRRVLLMAGLLAGGCEGPKVAARVTLAVRTQDVYLVRGQGIGASTTALANVSDANESEVLLNLVDKTIGSDATSPRGCKDLPIFWLPTIDLENTPLATRGSNVCARMPEVTVGSWKRAAAQLTIISEAGGNYRAQIDASKLVPSAVYSVWVIYAGPSGVPYAIAPLGGLPNLILTDDAGSGRFDHVVPSRQLKTNSLLTGAVPAEDTMHALPLRIDPDATIGFALYYHSDSQTNGNSADTTRQLPRVRVSVPGETGITVHQHLLATSKPL